MKSTVKFANIDSKFAVVVSKVRMWGKMRMIWEWIRLIIISRGIKIRGMDAELVGRFGSEVFWLREECVWGNGAEIRGGLVKPLLTTKLRSLNWRLLVVLVSFEDLLLMNLLREICVTERTFRRFLRRVGRVALAAILSFEVEVMEELLLATLVREVSSTERTFRRTLFLSSDFDLPLSHRTV